MRRPFWTFALACVWENVIPVNRPYCTMLSANCSENVLELWKMTKQHFRVYNQNITELFRKKKRNDKDELKLVWPNRRWLPNWTVFCLHYTGLQTSQSDTTLHTELSGGLFSMQAFVLQICHQFWRSKHTWKHPSYLSPTEILHIIPLANSMRNYFSAPIWSITDKNREISCIVDC